MVVKQLFIYPSVTPKIQKCNVTQLKENNGGKKLFNFRNFKDKLSHLLKQILGKRSRLVIRQSSRTIQRPCPLLPRYNSLCTHCSNPPIPHPTPNSHRPVGLAPVLCTFMLIGVSIVPRKKESDAICSWRSSCIQCDQIGRYFGLWATF